MEKHPDDKELQRITKEQITLKSRDNARTPMQVSLTAAFKYDRSITCFAVEQLQICWLFHI
jgi:hypothetical protein